MVALAMVPLLASVALGDAGAVAFPPPDCGWEAGAVDLGSLGRVMRTTLGPVTLRLAAAPARPGALPPTLPSRPAGTLRTALPLRSTLTSAPRAPKESVQVPSRTAESFSSRRRQVTG